MFVLLKALQLTTIQHGQVMRDIQINTKLNETMKYEMFKLDFPELRIINPYNTQYQLFVDFQASCEVELIFCEFPNYDDCVNDQFNIEMTNTTGTQLINIEHYVNPESETFSYYLMFRLSGENAVGQVTFQAQSVIILIPQQEMTVMVEPQIDMYLMIITCDKKPFNFTIDTTAQICSDKNAHVNKQSCSNIQTGQQFTFNNPNLYTFITIFATSELQELRVQYNFKADTLSLNESTVRKVYLNPNCFTLNSLSKESNSENVGITQEVLNVSYTIDQFDVCSFPIFEGQYNLFEGCEFQVWRYYNPNIGSTIFSYSRIYFPVMPWTNDEVPYLLVEFVIAINLRLLYQKIVWKATAISALYFEAPDQSQNLSYGLAFVGMNNISIQVTDRFEKQGVQCKKLNNDRCQLIIDNSTQIQIADKQYYYVFSDNLESRILCAPIQAIEPNTPVNVKSISGQYQQQYYRVKTENFISGKLILSCLFNMHDIQAYFTCKKAFFKIVASASEYLPQIMDQDILIASGLGVVELVLSEDVLTNEIFFCIINQSNSDFQVQIQFVGQLKDEQQTNE
ncbi:Conserved_hypothetical protein [Hexamita inflata]|uniref:Uncharacterized protein n=1 Tax=Hexamita inflata TaxID=28002 RepID=A0AA86NST3_9EUKA|nr:Conserved hypothetical protein [Hexamita inflata]